MASSPWRIHAMTASVSHRVATCGPLSEKTFSVLNGVFSLNRLLLVLQLEMLGVVPPQRCAQLQEEFLFPAQVVQRLLCCALISLQLPFYRQLCFRQFPWCQGSDVSLFRWVWLLPNVYICLSILITNELRIFIRIVTNVRPPSFLTICYHRHRQHDNAFSFCWIEPTFCETAFTV